jgi:hypothetical protein
VTLPAGAVQRELANMVQFQVEKELPFPPHEAVIDFTVESHYDVGASLAETAPAAGGVDVLVAAARLPVVDHYRQIAAAAGVRLLRLGLRPYANVRCVEACTRRGAKEALLVVHFGADETEIDVLVGSSLTFSRSVAVKIPPVGGDAHQLAESVRAVAMEVVRSVQSYQAVERVSHLDSILVAGGTGVEAVAAEELSARLGAPCELFNPTVALGLGLVESPSAFISALGLVIAQGQGDQLPFDFLNPKRPPVERNWSKVAAWAAAAGVVLALAGAVTAGTLYLGGKEAAVEEVRARLNKEKEKQRQLLSLKKRVTEISKWQAERRDWLAHWAYLSSLLPPCTEAYIGGLKTVGDDSITFTVKARESKTIAELDEKLAQAGYKLQAGGLATAIDRFGYIYSAEVQVYVTGPMAVAQEAVKPPARPADDDSIARLMAEAVVAVPAAGGATTAPAPGPAAAKPATPAIVVDEATRQQIRKDIIEGGWDRDHNGKLSRQELMRPSLYGFIAKKYLKLFDKNGNGKIDKDEYTAITEFLQSLRDSE